MSINDINDQISGLEELINDGVLKKEELILAKQKIDLMQAEIDKKNKYEKEYKAKLKIAENKLLNEERQARDLKIQEDIDRKTEQKRKKSETKSKLAKKKDEENDLKNDNNKKSFPEIGDYDYFFPIGISKLCAKSNDKLIWFFLIFYYLMFFSLILAIPAYFFGSGFIFDYGELIYGVYHLPFTLTMLFLAITPHYYKITLKKPFKINRFNNFILKLCNNTIFIELCYYAAFIYCSLAIIILYIDDIDDIRDFLITLLILFLIGANFLGMATNFSKFNHIYKINFKQKMFYIFLLMCPISIAFFYDADTAIETYDYDNYFNAYKQNIIERSGGSGDIILKSMGYKLYLLNLIIVIFVVKYVYDISKNKINYIKIKKIMLFPIILFCLIFWLDKFFFNFIFYKGLLSLIPI